MTYTMTQKRQEGEFKSKYIAVNSSSVKEHRILRTTFQYWKRGPCSTLLANSQGPNRHLIHRVRHEATINIPQVIYTNIHTNNLVEPVDSAELIRYT